VSILALLHMLMLISVVSFCTKPCTYTRQAFLILETSLNNAGCPIIWLSKLQTEIALSTCEAEYITSSMSIHYLLPLWVLLCKISSTFTPQTLHSTSTCHVGCTGSNIITKQIQSYMYDNCQILPQNQAYCNQMTPFLRSDVFWCYHGQED
jgi:hypothetical protein